MKRMPLALRQATQKRGKPKADKPTAKPKKAPDFALAVVKPKPHEGIELPPGAQLLPDSKRYKCRMVIPSGDPESDANYCVSFDMALKSWVCSCRGFIRWRFKKPDFEGCRHLKAMGIRWTRQGDLLTYKQMLLRG